MQRVPRPAERLHDIVGFDIDAVARVADASDDVLRLENLDTDIAPPPEAIETTKAAVGEDNANSYLPFTGLRILREAVAAKISSESGNELDPDRNVVISSGGMTGLLSALLAIVDPEDEVIVTDPCYAGILARARLTGATVRQVPLVVDNEHWRLDLDRLALAFTSKTKAIVLCDPSMPTGCVLNDEEWRHVADLTDRSGALLLYDAAFQRVRFDGIAPVSRRR
jgi:aspartate/methionine/tyrosine aminotransferase